MKKLLPTAYLPPISYMAACTGAGEILVEAYETYPKQTIRNHCEIGGPNGIQRLTIPVHKPDGNHTNTKDIRIASHLSWQKAHWRSFETAYNKSPFFLYYKDYFFPYFDKEFSFLLDFNIQLLETVFMILRLDKPVILTEKFEKEVEGVTDLRQTVHDWNHALRSHEYYQVFAERHGFKPNLSIVDLIFNLGPEASSYLSTL